MRYFTQIICLFILPISFSIASCAKCTECTYYEENADTISYEEKLDGEYCGDEIRAVEKKEYATSADEAYVRCAE